VTFLPSTFESKNQMSESTPKFLLNSTDLQKEFADLLKNADSVKIAVAWATPGVPVEMLRNARLPTETIVGTNFQGTHPEAIVALRCLGPVWVDERKDNSTFHPKLYLFKRGPHHEAIIGSANLTDAAFNRNTEAAVRLRLDRKSAQSLLNYFQRLKKDLLKVNEKWLQKYRRRYKKSSTGPLAKVFNREGPQPSTAKVQGPTFGKLLTYNWPDYYKLLKQRGRNSREWDCLFDPSDSYLKAIELLGPIVRKPFDQVVGKEFRQLIGARETHPPYSWFGTLTPSGDTVRELQQNQRLRQAITNILPTVQGASDEKEAFSAAERLFEKMVGVKGIGPAAPTRFLTICRPDLFFSLNAASLTRLANVFGIKPGKLKTWEGYSEAHQMVWQSRWYQSPRPRQGKELQVWKGRVALLDLYAYKHLEHL